MQRAVGVAKLVMCGVRTLRMIALVLITTSIGSSAAAQNHPPKILCVQAHPDDETMYAATLYGIAQHLDGEVDADSVLQHVWSVNHVREHLSEILERGAYDIVLTLLPTPDTHGHHKSAGILALEAVASLPEGERPAVLGALATDAAVQPAFSGLAGYPDTVPRSAKPDYTFDRRNPLEEDSLLTYHVIVNWVIAEHMSQGTLQLLMNEWDVEHFWLYALNSAEYVDRAEAVFRRLNAWKP